MKKISALLLAAGMVAASAAPASAVDVKADGQFMYSYGTASTGFEGDNTELAKQRLRMGLTFAASENLSGYIQWQIMNSQFGTATSNAGDKDVQTRQMYMDFVVPATPVKVRMGRQCLGLPADAFGGNGVIDAGWGTHDGVVVTSPVNDWLGLTALWSRVGHDNGTDLDQNNSNDIYGLVANLKFDGVSASIYTAFATIDELGYDFENGRNASVGSAGLAPWAGHAYWIGATSTWTFFDPFTVKLSAAFGEYSTNESYENALARNGHGWNVQAKASYAMDFGTPVFGAWYFSGDDKEYGDGTMPSVTGYFTPTRTYHDAGFGLGGGQCYFLPSGNWGLQAGIEGMSFLKGLSHDFLINYIQGTNDKDIAHYSDRYLTTEDSLVSFDFITYYQIYKNLTACLELSYIISDFDDKIGTDTMLVTGQQEYEFGREAGDFQEDDWRVELSFEYKF